MRIVFVGYLLLVWSFIGCSGTSGSKISDNNKTQINQQKVSKNLPIITIGPSTVYMPKEFRSSLHYEDNSECPLYGWGELLGEFSDENSTIYDYARPGAGAGTFKEVEYDDAPENEKVLYGPNHDHYWAKTKEKMQELKEGILLIQFGGNDPRHLREKYPNISEEEMLKIFKANVKFYIDEAKELNFIPILITSIDKRIRDSDGKIGNHRGRFPDSMKELGQENSVRVLDLHQKSLAEYNRYTDEELKQKFANCYNRWQVNERINEGMSEEEAKNVSIENTHFEEHGAREVASWIRDLACEEKESILCRQFK